MLEPKVQLLNSQILMTLIFLKTSEIPKSLGIEIIRYQSSLPRSQRILGLLNLENDEVSSPAVTVWRHFELTNSRNIY